MHVEKQAVENENLVEVYSGSYWEASEIDKVEDVAHPEKLKVDS